jgi:2',3'-cyclic-nucleotide 2'-phosphodiesterase (5'-nucleotidase family)
MGGLSRRATVVERVEAETPTVIVDAGDLLWKSPTVSESRLAQQRIKAGLQLDSYALSGVDGMVPGEGDLALGLDWLSAAASERSLPYVAANLKCADWPLPSHRIVERGGLRVAIVGVVGMSEAGPCAATSTVPAVKAAVAESSDADVHILLSYQAEHQDASIVRSVPEIDVVVNGHARKLLPVPNLLEGKAIQLAAGTRGKKLGIADLTFAKGGEGFAILGLTDKLDDRLQRAIERRERTELRVEKARTEETRLRAQQVVERIDRQVADLRAQIETANAAQTGGSHTVLNRFKGLTDDVADHPETQRLVDAAKERMETVASAIPPKKTEALRPFVGDRMCQACHSEQHAQWKSTPHAYAWSTLVRVKRSQDLDCFACHVTGAHHKDGPQTPAEASGLENVGCESCHGPGGGHVQSPSKSNIVLSPSESVCVECHDGEKDEGRFDLETYLPKVQH